MACLVGLLLPLMLRAAPGRPAAMPAHAWPVAATAAPAAAPRDFVASPSTGKLTDQAVQTLKQILAQPAAPRRNLVQIELNRRVRLAFLSAPQWTREVSGRHLMCIPVLSLQW